MKNINASHQALAIHRIVVFSCISAILGLAGCENEGSAERAGQKIDRAAENATQKIEQATDNATQKIEAAKQSLDQKAATAGQYIDQTAITSVNTIEQAGAKLNRETENAHQKLEQSTEQAGKELEGAKQSILNNAELAGDYIDDSVISLKVKTALLNDAQLKNSIINVVTIKGVVQLSGTVDSEQYIGRATELANSQSNVKAVQTNLTVNIGIKN